MLGKLTPSTGRLIPVHSMAGAVDIKIKCTRSEVCRKYMYVPSLCVDVHMYACMLVCAVSGKVLDGLVRIAGSINGWVGG